MAHDPPDTSILSMIASAVAILISIVRPAIAASGKLVNIETRVDALENDQHERDKRLEQLITQQTSQLEKLIDVRLKRTETDIEKLFNRRASN